MESIAASPAVLALASSVATRAVRTSSSKSPAESQPPVMNEPEVKLPPPNTPVVRRASDCTADAECDTTAVVNVSKPSALDSVAGESDESTCAPAMKSMLSYRHRRKHHWVTSSSTGDGDAVSSTTTHDAGGLVLNKSRERDQSLPDPRPIKVPAEARFVCIDGDGVTTCVTQNHTTSRPKPDIVMESAPPLPWIVLAPERVELKAMVSLPPPLTLESPLDESIATAIRNGVESAPPPKMLPLRRPPPPFQFEVSAPAPRATVELLKIPVRR